MGKQSIDKRDVIFNYDVTLNHDQVIRHHYEASKSCLLVGYELTISLLTLGYEPRVLIHIYQLNNQYFKKE